MSTTKTIEIALVNNKNIVLKEGKFTLVDGRLPLTQIGKQFQVKDLVWTDCDYALKPDDRGLSDMNFANMNRINVTGTAL